LAVRGAAKVAKTADNASDAAKAIDKATDATTAENANDASKGVDFVTTPDGTSVTTSQSRMKEGFDNAGFIKQPASKESTFLEGGFFTSLI
jgi:hypothetical protein